MTATQRPQPCLTRRDGVVCQGTLLPVTDREWHCTEGHVMWGTPSALRSEPWPADLPACPSRSPHTPLGFYCSLVANHPLPHVALDESRQIMATWPTHVEGREVFWVSLDGAVDQVPIIRGESVRLWHPWEPHAWWPLRCPARESAARRCRRWRWHNDDHWTPDGSEEGIWWR